MRLSPRRGDDADVIRARLRALLTQDAAVAPGWLPGDDLTEDDPADDGVQRTVPLDALEEPALPPGLGRHRAPGTATRWDPGRRGARGLWAAAVLAVAVVLGWTWLDRPVVEPVAAPAPVPAAAPVASQAAAPSAAVGEAAGASAAVVVSVVGQVARPGLVTLGPGARVADAVEAAGGFLPEADPASVNQAAPVVDGQQIAVGVPGAIAPGEPAPVGGQASAGGPAPAGSPVDLNTAGVAELDALPGLGPVLAQRIVDHRTRNGPFRSVEQLDDVPGIGPAIAAALADQVAV